MKKVVLEIADFDKLAMYITSQPVRFQNAAQALEIDTILKRAELMDIELKKPEKK
jgi:hypothetical protein